MMSDATKLLAELIALPSVNPAFLPAGHAHAGEHRVAEFLASKAEKRGLEISWMQVSPQRANVMATLRPLGKVRQRLWLAPHMDTVNIFSPEQFTPKVRQGRLYGRGACDTKGSIAAMFSALLHLADGPSRPVNTEITFVGLIDEENGQRGSRALAASGQRANLAIVGEPTNSQIVTAHKGSLWLEIETKGKAAHGARPDLGKNAVHEMAQVVHLLETKYAQRLKARRHSVLRHATISVGTIAGGLQPNVVPARCLARADRRTLPGETEKSVLKELATMIRQNGLHATVRNEKQAPCLSLETDPTLPLVKQFLVSTRQKKALGVDYYCDASVLSHGGIPSIVFGPGDIGQAHTADEWVSLRQLDLATAKLLKYFQSLP